MPIQTRPPTRPDGNMLLTTLDQGVRDALPLETLHLTLKQETHHRGKRIDYLYFPDSCVLSVIAEMADGAAIESGTVGNEGFTGIEALLETERSANTSLCQIEGECQRMRVADLRAAIDDHPAFRRLALRYLSAYMGALSQSVACNRLHTIEEHHARWMLMTHDRVGADSFMLAQEFIAVMLGAHRPSVSLVIGMYQQAGLVSYSRGRVTILDRAGLEDICCECYGIMQAQYDAASKYP